MVSACTTMLSKSLCRDEIPLKYYVHEDSLIDDIHSINNLLISNNPYNLSLYFNEHIDYIDLSLIKDNVESIKIIYNSDCNINKIATISCRNKSKLKRITFNFNTDEKICCEIINCWTINTICIVGGNDVSTYIKIHSYLTITGYHAKNICLSKTTISSLKLEDIGDLKLDAAYYIKNGIPIGPITKDIGPIDRLSIEDIELYI